MKQKSFYVVSALQHDSCPLGKLKRLDSEKEAIEHAKSVISRRASEGTHALAFYILKVCAVVEPQTPPVTVKRLK
jgi:hypothetical protein